jgi:hypothetical protein
MLLKQNVVELSPHLPLKSMFVGLFVIVAATMIDGDDPEGATLIVQVG